MGAGLGPGLTSPPGECGIGRPWQLQSRSSAAALLEQPHQLDAGREPEACLK